MPALDCARVDRNHPTQPKEMKPMTENETPDAPETPAETPADPPVEQADGAAEAEGG